MGDDKDETKKRGGDSHGFGSPARDALAGGDLVHPGGPTQEVGGEDDFGIRANEGPDDDFGKQPGEGVPKTAAIDPSSFDFTRNGRIFATGATVPQKDEVQPLGEAVRYVVDTMLKDGTSWGVITILHEGQLLDIPAIRELYEYQAGSDGSG